MRFYIFHSLTLLALLVSPTFAQIPDGMRAVSVIVSKNPQIAPGSLVDVWLTLKKPEKTIELKHGIYTNKVDPDGRTGEDQLIMTGVKVISGQFDFFKDPTGRTMPVTLVVTQVQARELQTARTKGSIYLKLAK